MEEYRKKIDDIDDEILGLINDRLKIAEIIGKAKKEKDAPIFLATREAEIYRRLNQINKGPLKKEFLVNIFREIMSASINMQKKLVIAYLGPEATFTHHAAIKKFGLSVDYVAQENIDDVFQVVDNGKADYGVVPVENSTGGSVTNTLDLFSDSECKICSEIYLPIRQHLLFKGEMDQIKKVYSKNEIFAQCRKWISANLSGVELLDASSTARAVEIASKEKGVAAIASELAGEIYDVPVLEEGIEDITGNVTRFLVIGKNSPAATNQDKTSLLYFIKDEVGSLYSALIAFQSEGINLCKIESRPSKRKKWEYCFFVDCLGHIEEEKMQKAIKKLQDVSIYVKVLGSYPVDNWNT